MGVVIRTQRAAERCPFCRDQLPRSEATACARCGTPHHADCLAESGRCSVLACGRPTRPPSQRVARPGEVVVAGRVSQPEPRLWPLGMAAGSVALGGALAAVNAGTQLRVGPVQAVALLTGALVLLLLALVSWLAAAARAPDERRAWIVWLLSLPLGALILLL